MNAVALTALWTAAARARETERGDRLFDDPLAALLAGDAGFAMLDRTPAVARDSPYIPLRTRYFDDWSLAAARAGIRQIVLVAAGMDTRAFRLGWPAGTRLWEVDQPDLLAAKERALTAAAARPRCARRTVAADLTAPGWPAALGEAGFEAAAPAAWLVEGLLQYLPEEAVDRVLAGIGAAAGAGSRLAADVLSADHSLPAEMRDHVAGLGVSGRPWRFGTNEPAALLERHGWVVERVAEPGDQDADFGRWPRPRPAEQPAAPGRTRGFLVTARR